MKLRYRGDGKVLITGIAHEFHDGDEIELPDKVAKKVLKNRFFEEVQPKKVKTKIVEGKK